MVLSINDIVTERKQIFSGAGAGWFWAKLASAPDINLCLEDQIFTLATTIVLHSASLYQRSEQWHFRLKQPHYLGNDKYFFILTAGTTSENEEEKNVERGNNVNVDLINHRLIIDDIS